MIPFRGNSKSYNRTPQPTPALSPLPAASVESPGADPSMEDIFADIRRTLAEEEGPRPQAQSWEESSATAPYGVPASTNNNVVVLDNPMVVTAPASAPPETISPAPEPTPPAPSVTADPVAPEAATDSISGLVRTMVVERSMLASGIVQPVENIVRDTVRSLIREWLEANLPHLVERAARAEVERLLGRAV